MDEQNTTNIPPATTPAVKPADETLAKSLASALTGAKPGEQKPGDATPPASEADKPATDKPATDKPAADKPAAPATPPDLASSLGEIVAKALAPVADRLAKLETGSGTIDEARRAEDFRENYIRDDRWLSELPRDVIRSMLPATMDAKKMHAAHDNVAKFVKAVTDQAVKAGTLRYVNFGHASDDGGSTPGTPGFGQHTSGKPAGVGVAQQLAAVLSPAKN